MFPSPYSDFNNAIKLADSHPLYPSFLYRKNNRKNSLKKNNEPGDKLINICLSNITAPDQKF